MSTELSIGDIINQAISSGTPTASPDNPTTKRKGDMNETRFDKKVSNFIKCVEKLKLGLYRVTERPDMKIIHFALCPMHADDDGHKFECGIVLHRDGEPGYSCKHDDNIRWNDFKNKYPWLKTYARECLPSKGKKPEILYEPGQDTLTDFFNAIANTLTDSKKFYIMSGGIFYIDGALPPRRVTAKNFPGIGSSVFEIVYLKETKDGVEKKYVALPDHLSTAFVNSPEVFTKLPIVRQYIKRPVFTKTWRLINVPGYDAESQIYYGGDRIIPKDSTKMLDELLSEFNWETPVDRVNYIAALVTGFTMPHWLLGKHPFWVLNANKPRVGKTTLAKILSIVLDGNQHAELIRLSRDEEFEKVVATKSDSGAGVIVIDNVRTGSGAAIKSEILEMKITDSKLCFRRLGQNSAASQIERENDVIFVLTVNQAKLGMDLFQRCVPVNLNYEGDAEKRRFSKMNIETFAYKNRNEIVAEIMGMVLKRIQKFEASELTYEALIPEGAAQHSVSGEWAGTMDGILRESGYVGLLKNQAVAQIIFDPKFEAVRYICERFGDGKHRTAKEWVFLLHDIHLPEANVVRFRMPRMLLMPIMVLRELGVNGKGIDGMASSFGKKIKRLAEADFDITVDDGDEVRKYKISCIDKDENGGSHSGIAFVPLDGIGVAPKPVEEPKLSPEEMQKIEEGLARFRSMVSSSAVALNTPKPVEAPTPVVAPKPVEPPKLSPEAQECFERIKAEVKSMKALRAQKITSSPKLLEIPTPVVAPEVSVAPPPEGPKSSSESEQSPMQRLAAALWSAPSVL